MLMIKDYKILWITYLIFPFTLMPLHSIQKGLYYLIIGISLITILYKLYKQKMNINTCNVFLFFLGLFAFLIFLTIIIPEIYGTKDNSFFLNLFDYFLKFLILCTICLFCKTIDEFFDCFIIATSIYVFSSIILLIPSLRLLYSDYMYSSTNENEHSKFLMAQGLLYYTRFGLQGFSGFEHTFKCSLSFIFVMYKLTLSNIPNKKRFYYFGGLINFFGCCLYGRIGILSCCMSFFFYFLYITIFKRKVKILFILSVICFFVILIFLLLFEQIKNNPTTNWMFEPFINLVETGKISSASSNGLKTMYFKPSIDTLFHGDGFYEPNGHYYKGTDVGILRPLLFWGLFGSMIYYSCFFVLLLPIYNYFSKRNAKFLIILFLLQNLLFELKGEVNLTFISILFVMNVILLTKKINRQSLFRLGLKK